MKRLFDSIEFRSSLGIDFSRQNLPVQMHYVIVSLKSVPRNRVTEALSTFQSLDDATFHRVYESDCRPTVDVFVHVIGGVKSEAEFSETFRTMIRRYGMEKGA